jgi:CRP-like cAMP-binding protein
MIDVNLLNGIKFLDSLNKNELEKVAEFCHLAEFKKGSKIFNRGDHAESLYIIRSGKVDLCLQISILLETQEIVVDTKQEGDFFGWSSLIYPYKLTLSANCNDDCELIRMDGKNVLSLCHKENHIGFIIMRNLAKVIGSRLDRMQFICEQEIELNVPTFGGIKEKKSNQ